MESTEMFLQRMAEALGGEFSVLENDPDGAFGIKIKPIAQDYLWHRLVFSGQGLLSAVVNEIDAPEVDPVTPDENA